MNLTVLDPFPKKHGVRVVIETPKGARNKVDYDPELEAFCLRKTLPAGMVFPYDFGFVPQTLGEDGDPLDVMLLMPESVPCGCIVHGRLIGVIEGRQSEGKNWIRNDRFVVVNEKADTFSELTTIKDLPRPVLEEVEEFFATYNRLEGRTFQVLGIRGPKAALKLLQAGRVLHGPDRKAPRQGRTAS